MTTESIHVHKTFYAIGQGHFYSEEITFQNSKKIIVYDCGSIQSGKRIDDEIKHFPYKEIDYLIISHLDNDHFNKIKSLDKVAPIKKIILPKQNQLDLTFFFKTCKKNKKLVEYYFELKKTKKIIEISNIENESNNVDLENTESSSFSHNSIFGFFPLSTSNPNSKTYYLWNIKFYVDESNYQDKNGKDILSSNDKNLIDSISDYSSFCNQESNLKKIYSSIKNTFNGSSMAMISAPNIHFFYHNQNNYATWMNGDIFLNDNKKTNKIINHFIDFHCFNFDYQLQHHGSCKNFFRPITEFGKMNIYIYYGMNNTFGHPHGNVLRKIKQKSITHLTEFDKNVYKSFIWEIPWWDLP